jgi:hypothetical protein
MAADLSGDAHFVGGRTAAGQIVLMAIDYSDVYPDPQPLYLVDLAASRAKWGVSLRGRYLEWDNLVALANWEMIDETSWYLEAAATRITGVHWTVLVGLRYFDLDFVIEGPYRTPWPPQTMYVMNEAWLDPFAGATFRYPLGGRWKLAGRGDIGGFGVGSKLSWGLEATVLWRIGTQFSLVAGYRVFDVDFEEENTYSFSDGSQLNVPDTYDTRTNGPILGMTFQW